MQLTGSKVLITQMHLLRYMGSEIVTLELAEYLAGQGAEVVIATHSLGYPIRQEFDRIDGVTVFELWDAALAANLEARLPDLAWIQHSIIPVPVLERADEILFVFHHMSSILPAEFTMAATLETALATAVLFESPRSLEIHRDTGLYEDIDSDRLQVMGNPAPAPFGAIQRTASERRRLTVVSNHIPSELVEAFAGLREHFDLDVIGSQTELGATPRRVSPATLENTDAMVSIGKTVQYSIVAGVPVYCYDHFGGPGWITRENIEDTRWENFSGRRAGTKAAADIVTEITDGFDAAVAEAVLVRRDWSRAYLLSHRVDDLLQFASERRKLVSKPSRQEIRAHANVQAAFGSYVREWIRMHALSNELTDVISQLQAEANDRERVIGEVQQELTDLRSSKLYRRMDKIRHSWAYRSYQKLRGLGGPR